jgi:hypothetical protein
MPAAADDRGYNDWSAVRDRLSQCARAPGFHPDLYQINALQNLQATLALSTSV